MQHKRTQQRRLTTTPPRFASAAFALWLLLGLGASPLARADADYREVTWQDLLIPTGTPAPTSPHRGPYSSPPPDPWSQPAEQVNRTISENVAAQAAEARRAEHIKGRADLDGRKIVIAGYVVPLEDSPDRAISEFFLVPYVGACIHVPPPPPDQIVYVKIPRGIKIEDIYQAYRVSGTLHTQPLRSGLADTAYVMAADSVVAYDAGH